MLRTNLATRPFYNQRAVRIGIGALVVLAAALSAFNAAQVVTLTSSNRDLASRAEVAEARATDLRQQALAIRQALNRADVGAVRAAAKEANELIDRRAFSWTDLFNRFEETLPAEVRIMAVRPQVDTDGRMLVAITIISRTVEQQEEFADKLEATGAFTALLPREQQAQDDGTLRAVLQGYYLQPSAVEPAAVPGPPTSEPGSGTPGNQSGANATGRGPSPEGAR